MSPHSIAFPDVAAQTLEDIFEDFTELQYLATSAVRRLSHLHAQLRPGTLCPPETQAIINNLFTTIAPQYETLRTELQTALVQRNSWQASDIPTFLSLKMRGAHTLRTLQSLSAALLVATDWQAPSYLHTQSSEAGTQTGRIVGTVNDYKRDNHQDATAYEVAFRKAYIDAPWRFPPQVYATSSGMSAFATVVTCLRVAGKLEGRILVGKNSYFENKIVLEQFFAGQLQYVDEMDTDGILAAVTTYQPAAIFLDSLCNTENIAVADLSTLLPALSKILTRPTTLVLDNTCLGIHYQPFRNLPHLPHKLQVIVVESLMKYHQFGMDRVTGGIIWKDGLSPLGIFGSRMHLGTGMPDASVLAMPVPNRALLTARTLRMSRNATYLAETLQHHIAQKSLSPVSHIVYPGLNSHPAHAWSSKRTFQGSFLVLAFKPLFQHPSLYKRWIACAISEAKRAGVSLNAGTSFGFTTTRVYLTALHSNKTTTPFVRISVGTETAEELQKLASVFIRAIDSVVLPL